MEEILFSFSFGEAGGVLRLFLKVPCVGLQSVIVAFPGYTLSSQKHLNTSGFLAKSLKNRYVMKSTRKARKSL